MARVTTYLNFQGQAEEAFNFYRSVFGTDYVGPILRMADMHPNGGADLPEEERGMIMHAEVEILAGHVLMATDMLTSMGHEVKVGNNTTINLEPGSREEVDRLYAALSEGGGEANPPMDVPWGYWGVCLDRFGIRWMFNHMNEA